MSSVVSPVNDVPQQVHGVWLVTSASGLHFKAVPGTSEAISGVSDTAAATVQVGTIKDDAAPTLGTTPVVGVGFLADQTSPDSVDEGDLGFSRMTLDRLLRVVSQQRSNAATKANVGDATSSTTILASNALRTGATIWNDSGAVLYLDLTGGTASATSCTVKVGADGYYEVPYGYHGAITGIWASDAGGSARVTEFTAP